MGARGRTGRHQDPVGARPRSDHRLPHPQSPLDIGPDGQKGDSTTPTGGDVGRGLIDEGALEAIDRVGSHEQMAAALDESADDVRTWWTRNNYQVRDLALRSDLRPPLFDIPTASAELRRRIDEYRSRRA